MEIIVALLGTGKWLLGCLLGTVAYFKYLLTVGAALAV